MTSCGGSLLRWTWEEALLSARRGEAQLQEWLALSAPPRLASHQPPMIRSEVDLMRSIILPTPSALVAARCRAVQIQARQHLAPCGE